MHLRLTSRIIGQGVDPSRHGAISAIDILRSIAEFDASMLFERSWMIAFAETYNYPGAVESANIRELFNEGPFPDPSGGYLVSKPIQLSGVEFMQRCALVFHFEALHAFCIKDAALPFEQDASSRFSGGPRRVEAANADFEIWTTEPESYEVISEDENLMAHLSNVFMCEDLDRERDR